MLTAGWNYLGLRAPELALAALSEMVLGWQSGAGARNRHCHPHVWGGESTQVPSLCPLGWCVSLVFAVTLRFPRASSLNAPAQCGPKP